MGTFEENDKLGETLARFSLVAALRDYRFIPISLEELTHLSVEISLLRSFEEIEDPLDWEIDIHGVLVLFTDEKG